MTLREAIAGLREEIRRPEYTGSRRCWPCTVLNTGLVIGAGWALARRNGLAGVLLTAVGLGLVSVRGYVVPGTPRFAPLLVEPLPVEMGHDAVESDSIASVEDPERILEELAGAGILRVEDDALFLDRSFREAWRERVEELRGVTEAELTDRAVAASPADVDGQRHGDRILLAGESDTWLRPAVAVAETAAIETLAEFGVDQPLRARAAAPLRTFLRTCPACGGEVRETTLKRCCGGPGSVYGHPERPVLACADCETVVCTFETES